MDEKAIALAHKIIERHMAASKECDYDIEDDELVGLAREILSTLAGDEGEQEVHNV